MINGNEYAWEDAQVKIEGKTDIVLGIVEFEYTTEKDHKEIYGKGADPIKPGRGLKKYSGKMVVLQSELEAMQAGLPFGKDITDLRGFNVTISYAPEGGKATTDQWLGTRVKKFTKGLKTEDGNMQVELECAIMKINYNI